jgi:hypothetical protein
MRSENPEMLRGSIEMSSGRHEKVITAKPKPSRL